VQSSPIADVFTSKRPLPARKPLPPIMSPEPKLSDDTDRSLVFVEKQDSPLPPLPHSPPAPITPKRRSNSYSEARPLLPMPLPLPTASSALASPPQTPDRRRESGFGGILDVFKGELSMLDPISLDLRDPSTPPRPFLRTVQADGLALSLSPRDDDRVENKTQEQPASTSASPTTQSPPEAATHEEPSHNNSVSAIVPPRTSSLFAPRASLTGHASGTRSPQTQPQAQLPGHGPLRSRSGPTTLAAQSQVYRDGARLRVLHRSTASSSEPSLISAVDDARARVHASSSSSTTLDLAPSTGDFDSLLARAAAGSAGSTIALRRGSEPYTSPDSANFVTSSTPLITNDELPDDMEARGKELASRCWNENEDFLAKEKIAEWLGGQCVVLLYHHCIQLF
jgi:PH/SEC7 domain-containing protein